MFIRSGDRMSVPLGRLGRSVFSSKALRRETCAFLFFACGLVWKLFGIWFHGHFQSERILLIEAAKCDVGSTHARRGTGHRAVEVAVRRSFRHMNRARLKAGPATPLYPRIGGRKARVSPS